MGPRRSSGSSSRVRFLGSESDKAHGRWFRVFAEHYDTLAAAIEPRRTPNAAAALHRLFRRRGPVRRILDVACGTFSIDLGLVKRGYSVVGRDLSAEMIRASRRNLREAGLRANVAVADMRSLQVGGASGPPSTTSPLRPTCGVVSGPSADTFGRAGSSCSTRRTSTRGSTIR